MNVNAPPSPKSNSLKSAPAALVSSEKEKCMLFQDVNIIGRNENALICLKDQLISRKHCTISRTEDNKFTICDTSLTGTYVNGIRLVKNRVQTLKHKDKISLGGVDKYVYIFFSNKTLDMKADQSEQLNSQMQKKILNLDNTHSIELGKLNQELRKIESEKFELREEMNSKLEAQKNLFKKERKRLSEKYSNEQEEKAEANLMQMKKTFEEEKNKLMEEVERKTASMNKKVEELQQIKTDLEIQHERDRKELEEKYKIELMKLKLQLEISGMEQDRLQEETRKAMEQLAESKQILLDCELEQVRLANEKVEVETKLASTIINLTNEKDNVVKELKRKFKENEQERMDKEIEGLEEHLMCSICTELFIEPTVLNCGHMFCKTCIGEWKNKKKICPLCRTKITGFVPVLNLDSIIERNIAMLPVEAKEHRDSVIKSRKNPSSKAAKRKKGRNSSFAPQVASVVPNQTTAVPSQNTIPMVQIPNYNFVRDVFSRRPNDQGDLGDPFRWIRQSERAPSSIPVEERLRPFGGQAGVAMAIDLTNIVESPVQQPPRTTATATSTSGLIDLTVTP